MQMTAASLSAWQMRSSKLVCGPQQHLGGTGAKFSICEGFWKGAGLSFPGVFIIYELCDIISPKIWNLSPFKEVKRSDVCMVVGQGLLVEKTKRFSLMPSS